MADWMGPAMFGALVVFLLLGYPVAFTLGGIALVSMAFGIAIDYPGMSWQALESLPIRIFGIMANSNLLAIPFFTFMGLILERSGMAEELLETIGMLFGRMRGGLAYAVILVGALLAATTGVVAASVIAMGLISLPIMMRTGYDRRLASGVITASGTLAQIIPPSLVLIVLADQLGTAGEASVGDMYRGAFIPGFILTAMYLAYVFVATLLKPNAAPPLPDEALKVQGWALFQRVILVMVPPLALIFLVLGTVFMGIATPTEGGAMGVVGALALSLAKRRVSLRMLTQAMESTARITAFVTFILLGSNAFNLVFRLVNGDLWVESLFTGLPGGQIGFLIVANLAVFLLAFFLEFFEIAFIIVPLLAPIAVNLGIDLVWFGVMLGVNMQTSFMHPPFGFALFYLRSVAPKEIKTTDIYWGAIPYVVIQLIGVALVASFPVLSNPSTPSVVFTGQNVLIGVGVLVAFLLLRVVIVRFVSARTRAA